MIDKKRIKKIQSAVHEAKRFIRAAQEWEAKLSIDAYAIYGSVEGGAAKRASMDLTRALAEMRKPCSFFP